MLGAMVVAGAAGLGSVPAQAAEFGIYARGPVAYVPPCPGPGYVWMDGYMADGYWIPGRWEFVGYRDRDRDRFERRDFGRHDFDRRDFDRHDRDRHDWGRDSYRHDDRDRR